MSCGHHIAAEFTLLLIVWCCCQHSPIDMYLHLCLRVAAHPVTRGQPAERLYSSLSLPTEADGSWEVALRKPLAVSRGTTLYDLEVTDAEYMSVSEQMQSTIREHKDACGGVFTHYNIVKVCCIDPQYLPGAGASLFLQPELGAKIFMIDFTIFFCGLLARSC